MADSISWMRFCRIPLGTRVPHPSTLEKITTRCGPDVIEQLNRALLVKADRAKVLKTDNPRVPAVLADSGQSVAADRLPPDFGQQADNCALDRAGSTRMGRWPGRWPGSRSETLDGRHMTAPLVTSASAHGGVYGVGVFMASAGGKARVSSRSRVVTGSRPNGVGGCAASDRCRV